MKRGWNTLNDERGAGSEKSYQLGQALAAIADPELMESLLAVVGNLKQFGGQYMVAAQRERVSYRRIPNPDGTPEMISTPVRDPEGSDFLTLGFIHHYKHIPDALKDALHEPTPDSLEHVEPISWMEAEGGAEIPEEVFLPEDVGGETEYSPEEIEAMTPEELAEIDPTWAEERDKAEAEKVLAESSE